ncbi:MAG: hypothetical protein M3Q70_01565 [bacterium]|nr:hypothetical protein [bacterium]
MDSKEFPDSTHIELMAMGLEPDDVIYGPKTTLIGMESEPPELSRRLKSGLMPGHNLLHGGKSKKEGTRLCDDPRVLEGIKILGSVTIKKISHN